jgi:ribA/ribD-fused uncharacterized protein
VAEDDPTAPIDRFRWQYGFLSNFHPCKVEYGMHKFDTVEAAYQASKSFDLQEQRQIREAASPFAAKRLGQNVALRPDWEKVKREIMAELLFQKFILNWEFRDKLLATGERQLIEGNTHGDKYWGVCGGVGENHLGKMLMAMRTLARLIVSRTTTVRTVDEDESGVKRHV